MLMSCVEIPMAIILNSRPVCQTLSNAFSTSKRAAAVFLPQLVWVTMSSITLVSWRVVLCCGRNPNCSGRILFSVHMLSLTNKRRSKIFDRVLKREIGRWFIACFGSLPPFGSIIISAVFHGSGKYSSLAQPLKIWHM